MSPSPAPLLRDERVAFYGLDPLFVTVRDGAPELSQIRTMARPPQPTRMLVSIVDVEPSLERRTCATEPPRRPGPMIVAVDATQASWVALDFGEAVAEDVQAVTIVCGSRRLTRTERRFTGSVGDELASFAAMPVAVVAPGSGATP